jgi:diacylglycerol kinase family enzyme
VDWEISLTKKSGDAEHMARAAVESGADVVAAYGGDGTVMEVARGVMGSEVPMAILPGGTANLMSVELEIPKDLTAAAQIILNDDSRIKLVDMGQIGETYFMLRIGLGIAAQKVELADREMKDKYGILAYSIAALQAIKDAKQVQYKFSLDGEEVGAEGITCLVDNAGNFGVSYFHWQAKEIRIEADPPQSYQVDGEIGGQTPIFIKTIPQAVKMICGPV